MNDKQIGANIRQIRKTQKISLEELCKATGINISTLSKIETGTVYPPSKDTLEKIANALHSPLEKITGEMSLYRIGVETSIWTTPLLIMDPPTNYEIIYKKTVNNESHLLNGKELETMLHQKKLDIIFRSTLAPHKKDHYLEGKCIGKILDTVKGLKIVVVSKEKQDDAEILEHFLQQDVNILLLHHPGGVAEKAAVEMFLKSESSKTTLVEIVSNNHRVIASSITHALCTENYNYVGFIGFEPDISLITAYHKNAIVIDADKISDPRYDYPHIITEMIAAPYLLESFDKHLVPIMNQLNRAIYKVNKHTQYKQASALIKKIAGLLQLDTEFTHAELKGTELFKVEFTKDFVLHYTTA